MKGKVIAIGNQKGGVGKTTTALNMGAALSKIGYKVLLIDFDQQGNLSKYLGYHPDSDNDVTIFELLQEMVMTSEIPSLSKAINHSEKENLDYIPADISLSNAEMMLFGAMSREHMLKKIIDNEMFGKYDYIIIDCSTSIGIMFINALVAANGLIIPVQAQTFSLMGIQQILDVFRNVKKLINFDLELYGLLPTMVDNTIMAKSVVNTLQEHYNGTVFDTCISRRVEAAESTCEEISMVNKKRSIIGNEYINVTNELLSRIAEDK